MTLSPRAVCYLGYEEGLVPEAYLDKEGVWTWAMGIAETGGHDVQQYKNNPQPLDVCLRASISIIQHSYLPPVLEAFGSYALTEAQLAAALSFEWNTGAIKTTSWVSLVKSGDMVGAQVFLRNHYLDGTILKARRNREADLFFKGIWPSPMLTNVQKVAKPSYKPWGSFPTDISAIVQQIMGGS